MDRKTAPTRTPECSVLRSYDRSARGIVAAVAAVHVAAFDGHYLARCGEGFLRHYYRSVLTHDGGFLIVARGPEILGFAAGYRDAAAFARHYRSRSAGMMPWLGLALLRDPSLIGPTLANVRRRANPTWDRTPREVELSSIGILPEWAGTGVGRLLTDRFIRESARLGALSVTLTTDREDNERVNTIYTGLGFTLVGEEGQGGRMVNRYRMELPAA